MPIPNPVVWKVFRSTVHLMEFQSEVEEYFKTNSGMVVREPGGNRDEYFGTFQASGSIPGRLPIILGDCLQNLRSALDYLVWELVLATRNEPGGHNIFPICSTQETFDQQVKRNRLKGVAPEAIAEIRSLQPYHYGDGFDKSMLWVLDDLCNINQHRRVSITNLVGGPSAINLQIFNGELFGGVDFPSIRRNAKIGPFPIVDDPRGRGVLDVNPSITAYLAFDEGSTQNMDIGFVISHLLKFVTLTVLPKFERFFAQACISEEVKTAYTQPPRNPNAFISDIHEPNSYGDHKTYIFRT